MPYDMETNRDIIEILPGQELKVDHIYVNDIDMDALAETVSMIDKKVDAINNKLDKIIETLASDKAIVCSKDSAGHWNCHINLDNDIQEDEPLGI